MILSATLIVLLISATAADDPTPWYVRFKLGLEVGPTGAQFGSDPSDVDYAARFDGREIVRKVVEAGGQYVVIWARDGSYAYYDSKVVPKCPGLGERDVLRETVEEARKTGLPVIAYCVVQQEGPVLKDHPEFAMRDPQGRPIPGRLCLNSGYLDVMKALLSEQLAYGIAGFHIDMIDQGFGPPYGCWCDACRARFQAEHHRPMPAGVSWDDDWDRMLAFRARASVRFEEALRDHIRAIDPHASVDFNYHGYPPFSWEVGQTPVPHARVGDFVTGETGVWGFSALSVGLTAEFLAAATPGRPFQIAMQRGVRMYHDQTTRPLNDLRWELLTLRAHNAQVTLVDKTAYDGWLDPVAYERIGQAFRDAHARADDFDHPILPEVGLYYSARARDWYGRENPARYQQAFFGAHKALAYAHIPFEIVLDEDLNAERLARFPAVLLPGVAILADEEISLLRSYVEQGGTLIATGVTGTHDPMGRPTASPRYEDLVGARLVGPLDTLDNHVELPTSMGAKSIDWPLLVKGPAVIWEPTTATPSGRLRRPHRTVRQRRGQEGTDWPMSAGEAVGPAILTRSLGRGTVVTIAASPDVATASEHHVAEARRLLTDTIRSLNPDPIVSIDAPAHVEAVVTDEPEAQTLRIHLIGYLSPPASLPEKDRPRVIPVPMEDTPLFRAAIRVRRPIVSAEPGQPTTELQRDGQILHVLVHDVHGVVRVRYGSDSDRPAARHARPTPP
jgi:hypothetical protein